MELDLTSEIANRLGLKQANVRSVCDLLGRGSAIAYIAHFGKGESGGLRERQVRQIARLRRRLMAFQQYKNAARDTLQRNDKLTPEVRQALELARQHTVVADLVLRAHQDSRTAAFVAKERGLSGLADYLLAGADDGAGLDECAANFTDHSREVHTMEDALVGAGHIIAEGFSENARLRQTVRDMVWAEGELRCEKGLAGKRRDREFSDFVGFRERLNRVPPHRTLAINRGERKGVLKVTVGIDEEKLLQRALAIVVPDGARFKERLSLACRDAVLRLVLPEIDRQVRAELTHIAETHAIEVFASNMRTILMGRPVLGKRVLAITPGFRSGCKVVVIDRQGRLIDKSIIYPHKPHKKWIEAKTVLIECIMKCDVEVIAIGNGIGCREAEALVSETIADNNLDLQYAVVSEAGASAYAASDYAKAEFPDLDAALRGTISIARRLQDPLAEHVKVDPRVIGVGLYQHDVNQDELCEELDEAVRSCVAAVAVDLNRAGVAHLSYVAGLNHDLAEAILRWRDANGPFTERQQLRQVDGVDDDVFQQAAGFLFVKDGPNPFDATRIHPEWYPVAEKILAEFGYQPEDLNSPAIRQALNERVKDLPLDQLAKRLEIPMPVLFDIVGEFYRPAQDPRARRPGAIFKKTITRIEDLKIGMWVKGTVRNVVDFGAFIDVGLEEDGLLHISQFSKRYIRDPLKFLGIGDTIDVCIMSIDHKRQRTALSMIREEAKPAAAPPTEKKAEPESAAATAPKKPEHKPAPQRPEPARKTPVEKPAPVSSARAARVPRLSERGGPVAGPSARRPARRTSERQPGRKPATRASRPAKKNAQPLVRVFKSSEKEKPLADGENDKDENGLPKIRWAHYD